MNSSDITLLATALGSVIFLVVLIVSRIRLHPLLALIITSIAVGLVTGMPGDKLIKSIEAGAGHTLGAVGLVVALGAMLGRILAAGGVTESIANLPMISHTPFWALTAIRFSSDRTAISSADANPPK